MTIIQASPIRTYTRANDPLWAFATAYRWSQLGYVPRDPLSAFVLAYEAAALSALSLL